MKPAYLITSGEYYDGDNIRREIYCVCLSKKEAEEIIKNLNEAGKESYTGYDIKETVLLEASDRYGLFERKE